MVHRRRVPPGQGGLVPGGPRDAGLLRDPLHGVCTGVRGRAAVPAAAVDRGGAGRPPGPQGADQLPVLQPLARVHPAVLSRGLLPHPCLLTRDQVVPGLEALVHLDL